MIVHGWFVTRYKFETRLIVIDYYTDFLADTALG